MRTLLCLAVLMLVGPPARLVGQDLITFRFHGVVQQIQIDEGPAPPGVGVGSIFDGTYTFDPGASDSANYDYHGVYRTLAPDVVQASIDDFHWTADKSFVAIVDGEPHQTDVYEAGASRITLDSHHELAERLDIWIFQLTLGGDGGNLSDASLLLTPPDLGAWDEARLLMIGESSIYSGLDPMPAVMITASLTELEFAGDFQGDGDVDTDDLGSWQTNFGASGSATHGQGDADGNRVVDGSDFLAWQRQLAPAAAASSVPEPHSWAVAAAMGGVICYRRSRKCQPTLHQK